MAPGIGHLHGLRETNQMGRDPWGRTRAGQGCQPANRTFSFVEEGAREAIKTLKAAGMDAHRLLLLPRLAVLGTRGHGDLEGGRHDIKPSFPSLSPTGRMLRGEKPGPWL